MSERKATVLIVDAPSDRRAVTVMAHAKSPDVGKIYVTSGLKSLGGLLSHNCPRLSKDAVEVLPIPYDDPKGILKAAQEIKPDLVEVGQEDAIYLGVSDILRDHGFITFGVSRAAGKFEWDKAYARRKMHQAGAEEYLPKFRVFRKPSNGLEYTRRRFLREDYQGKLFIKAAYPALGKGVDGVSSVEEAEVSLVRISALPNRAGRVFLIEDGVGGPNSEEFSGYYLGNNFVDFGFYQDHKPVYDGDKGPNTGGMGSVGPLPWVTGELAIKIRSGIVNPMARSLNNQGLNYRGYLYLGGMHDPDTEGIWKIESNVRNGGSEAAVNIPGIKNDYFELTRSIGLGQDLDNPITIEHDGKYRVSIAGASLGYPEDYSRVLGRKVQGLEEVVRREEVTILGAAIEDDLTVSGGRIFWLVAEGDTLKKAIDLAYANMERIWIQGDIPGENLLHFRRDIGLKALMH